MVLKHDPDLVLSLLKNSAIKKESQSEIMINFFLYRSEYERALSILENLDSSSDDWANWKMNFHKGTTALLLSDVDKARASLIECHEYKETLKLLTTLVA